MSDVKSKVHNIIAATIAITLIIAVFSIIYLGCQKNPTPILSSLTLIGSFIGAFATLIAAYIACILFNDWRDTQRFNISKETLIALIKLKTHIDKHYNTAKYHLDSYQLKDKTPEISNEYVINRINQAKNCLSKKEEYKLELDNLLINFFEKVDIYEAISNITLIKNDDRPFNFQDYAFHVSNMYTKAYEGEIENINTVSLITSTMKNNFEKTYYNNLITQLKNDIRTI